MVRIKLLGVNGRMGKVIAEYIRCKCSEITLTDVLESADIILDFSAPHATLDALKKNLSHKTPVVIGTTGFTEEQQAEIKEYSQEFPILQDSNFSIGMNILFHMTKEISATHNFIINIHETHHKHKKDAPSGTALKLARLAEEEVDISFQRRGEVIGDHQISFTSDTEILELSHKALKREVFAEGAVQAALWLLQSEYKTGFYEMADVLGFTTAKHK